MIGETDRGNPAFQATFDHVLQHMRKQRKRSMKDDQCAYRGESGTMCAVGCLLPDYAYNSIIEGLPVSRLPYYMLECIGATSPSHVRLLGDLQQAHDGTTSYQAAMGSYYEWTMATFEKRMASVAQQWGLVYTPPVGEQSD